MPSIICLSIIVQSVRGLSVIMPNVIMLSIIRLSIMWLNVILLIVVMSNDNFSLLTFCKVAFDITTISIMTFSTQQNLLYCN